MKLDELEENLLEDLQRADPNTILEDKALIDNLENTKKTSIEIAEASLIAKKTELNINE